MDESISTLIGRIYDSAGDPDRWEEVLAEVRMYLGVRCLMHSVSDLRHADMHQSIVIGEPRRPKGGEEYIDHVYASDPTFLWATEHPNARFCDTEEIIPRDEYLDNEWVCWNRDEWIGSTHWIVGYTSPEDELTFGLSVHPWSERGPLAPDKKAIFKMLFNHMERAIRLIARPPVFASEADAVILLDSSGQVREMSPAACELLAENDGLNCWNGELHAANTSVSAKLRGVIASALSVLREGGSGGAVALPRPSGKRDLLLTVVPLVGSSAPFCAFWPAALVRIVDREVGPALFAAERWSDLFGLSPAETRLAEKLMRCDQNLRNAADELGITYNTARVHLKHLMDKTGTHSQAQLARLLSKID